MPPRLGVFVIGGAGVPASHITIAEPEKGKSEKAALNEDRSLELISAIADGLKT